MNINEGVMFLLVAGREKGVLNTLFYTYDLDL